MAASSKRGFSKIATADPDYEAGGGPTVEFNSAIDAIDAALATNFYNTSIAITEKEGMILIGGSGASLLTLAVPTAGLPSAGGDDGKVLKAVAVTAQAHTITTPSNGINGNKHVATFAAVGDYIELVAYNGKWYSIVLGGTPVALS